MSAPALANEVRYAKGSTIFRQGEPGQEMFVVAEGRVELSLGSGSHEKVVASLAQGEFFGELSLLSGAPRTANARAIEDSLLLAIDRDVFRMMVQDDLDVVFRMLSAQGRRLTQANRPIELMVRSLLRIRIFTHCARETLAAGGTSCTLQLEDIAREVGTDPDHVRDALSSIADQGAGSLRDGTWELVSQPQLQALLDAVARETVLPGG